MRRTPPRRRVHPTWWFLLGSLALAAATAFITGIVSHIGQFVAAHFSEFVQWMWALPLLFRILLGAGLVLGIGLVVSLLIVFVRTTPSLEPHAFGEAVLNTLASILNRMLDQEGKIEKRINELRPSVEETRGRVQEIVEHLESEGRRASQRPSVIENNLLIRELPAREALHAPADELLLPPPMRLVGRDDEFNWLVSKIESEDANSRIYAISGLPGLGKSSIVAAVIERMKSVRFRDGIAVVHGTHIRRVDELVYRVMRRFDPSLQLPANNDTAALHEIMHALLKDKDAIVVLDGIDAAIDMEIGKLVEVFTGHGGRMSVVITANHVVSAEVGAIPVANKRHLEVLSEESAMELFAQSYGLASSSEFSLADREGMQEIVRVLGNHTLAVKLAAARIHDTGRDLREFARDLASNNVPLFYSGPLAGVARAFETSMRALPPDARRLLVALAALETGEAGRRAVVALGAGVGINAPSDVLDVLILRSLVDVNTAQRMSSTGDRRRILLHPLLYRIVLERFKKWSSERQQEAYRALARHFASYVNSVDEAMLGADSRNILRAVEWAREQRENDLYVELCHGMMLYWHNRWQTNISRDHLPTAITAATARARKTGDTEDERRAAELTLTYGRVLRRIGKLDEAERVFKRDLRFRKRLRDKRGQAAVLHQLGQLARSRGHLQEAESYCRRALLIALEIGDRKTEGLALAQLGRSARARGNLADAEEFFLEALSRFADVNEILEMGVAFGYLGRIERTKGMIALAQRYFDLSERLARDVQDRRGVGVVLSQKGRIARIRGDLATAETYFNESIGIAQQIQDRQGLGTNYGYLGRIARVRGRLPEAEACFRESLQIAREVHDRQNEAVALSYLGRIARTRGKLRQARSYLKRGLKILNHIPSNRGIGIMYSLLGEVELTAGNLASAERQLKRGLTFMKMTKDRRGEGIVLSLLGQLKLRSEHIEQAAEYVTLGLKIAREVRDRRYLGINIRWCALVAEKRGDLLAAQSGYLRSLRVSERVDSKVDIAQTLTYLGLLQCGKLGMVDEGCQQLERAHVLYMTMDLSARELDEARAKFGCS